MEHQELITNYALVVALAVDDYQTDPYDMAIELKMTVSKIRPYYNELGCKFDAISAAERAARGDAQGTQGRWRVTLPVPLKFPEIGISRGPPRGR
jgi:DNA-directed RNA polymerase I subunit RPA49